jgi:hypothetical protein
MQYVLLLLLRLPLLLLVLDDDNDDLVLTGLCYRTLASFKIAAQLDSLTLTYDTNAK